VEKVEPVNSELDSGAVPVVEKQIEKDDAAVVEADTDAVPATGGAVPTKTLCWRSA